MHYLYIIKNILNEKLYIGQTNDPSRRWTFHKTMSRHNPIQYIHYAMAKHGIENFVFNIVEQKISQEDIDLLEKEYIDKFQTRLNNYGYNLSPGGDTPWNKGLSKELQPMYGKHHSVESIEKISTSQKGVPRPLHSEETKKKMSKSRMGIFCGENGPLSKLTQNDVDKIKIMLSDGTSANSIAKMYGVSARTILNIKHGKTWK